MCVQYSTVLEYPVIDNLLAARASPGQLQTFPSPCFYDHASPPILVVLRTRCCGHFPIQLQKSDELNAYVRADQGPGIQDVVFSDTVWPRNQANHHQAIRKAMSMTDLFSTR